MTTLKPQNKPNTNKKTERNFMAKKSKTAKMKKPRSEKQLANDERLRQAALAKKENNLAAKKSEPSIISKNVPTDHPHEGIPNVMPIPDGVMPKAGGMSDEQLEKVNAQPQTYIPTENELALEARLLKLQTQMDTLLAVNPNINKDEAIDGIARLSGARVGPDGVKGQVFRYPVEKGYYPDPTDRLYDDELLKRYAMRENFYFKWEVEGETYEKHGISYVEPRFIVELWRFMFNEENQPSGQMYLRGRQIQHEDEFVARVGADKMGLKQGIDYESFDDLMNEMRYQRIRTWLLGLFTPVKINTFKNQTKTMVIEGKQVEVRDTESLVDTETGIDEANTIRTQARVPGY